LAIDSSTKPAATQPASTSSKPNPDGQQPKVQDNLKKIDEPQQTNAAKSDNKGQQNSQATALPSKPTVETPVTGKSGISIADDEILILSLTMLEVHDLINTGTVMDKQDPALEIVVGKTNVKTER
jgi:hypothetical protein